MAISELPSPFRQDQDTGVDHKEPLPYQGKVMLVFGGSSGTGEVAVREFLSLGADRVYLGTRSEERFQKSQKRLTDLFDLDITSLRPFIADVADPNQVAEAVSKMKEEGIEPTHVFFFQAAGIEEFAESLQGHLDRLLSIYERGDANRSEQLSEGYDALNRDLDVWLSNKEFGDHARAVNFTGPVEAITILSQAYGGGFDVVDINSTFGHLGEGPRFYQNVLSKFEFSQWLKANTDTLRESGITTAEVVAPVIADTDVGKIIISRILPHYPEDVRGLIADTLVKKADVIQAARQHTDQSFEEQMTHPGLDVLYVMRRGGVVERGRGKTGPELIITSHMPPELQLDLRALPF